MDGILVIKLKVVLPEEKRPRKIEIHKHDTYEVTENEKIDVETTQES